MRRGNLREVPVPIIEARSEAELRLSEERYALAMEAAADGHMDWNFLNGEFYVSPRMLQIVGHPLDATFADRADWVARFPFHPEDRKRWEAAVAAHFAGREAIFKMDLRIVVNGEMRWLAFNFIATRDAAGKVVRWTGSITDLTDAKRDVATVVESIPGLVAILTPVGELDAVNDQLAEYCGQPLEAMKQWATNGTVHAEDLPRVAEIFMRGISTGEPYEFEARIRRFDGVYRWHQICGVPVRLEGGAIVRWYSVLVDIDDRKRALEELRVSESRFRALVELNAGGFWEQDANFRYLPTTFLHHITGYSNEERVGKTRWELPGDVTPLSGSWDEHKADLEAHRPFRDFEYRRVRKDGRIGYYSASGVPIFDDQGVFKGYYGVLSDITERKHAAEALRLSEERYALALEAAEEGHFDSDLRTDQNFASARTNEIFGLPRQATVANRLELLAKMPIHPDDRHIVGELSKSGWGDPAADLQEIEFRIVPRPGEIRWIHSRAKVVRDDQGRPRRRVGVVADITDRKRAEEALRESEDRFVRAVAGSADGVWDIDLIARSVYFSPRTRELCGLPPGPELVPLDGWFEALPLHPEDLPRRFAAMQAHLSGKAPAYDGEFRFLQPDGVYRWRHLHGVCVRDADGKPLRVAGSMSDVDVRRRAEEALRESERRYERAMLAAEAGFWDWDVPADKLYLSPKLLEMTGFPPGTEFASRSDFSARAPIYPGDWAKWESAVEELFASGGTRLSAEVRTIHGAEIHWYAMSGICARDSAGKVQRWTGSATDITARKRAEEELRLSEERYGLAMEASEEGHFDWNVRTDEIFVSAPMKKLLGLPADLQCRTRTEMFAHIRYYPGDRERVAEATRRVLATDPERHELEYRVMHGEEVRWLRRSWKTVRDAQGVALRAVGALTDITERKRAEEALLLSEERYALAMHASGEGHWDWKIPTGEFYVSPRYLELLRLPADTKFPTRPDFIRQLMFHPEDRAPYEAAVAAHFAGETPRLDMVIRLLPEGQPRWLHVIGVCTRDDDGKPERWAGSVADITDRRLAEEALREQTERLQLGQAAMRMIVMDWNLAEDVITWSDSPDWLRGPMPASRSYPPFEDQVHHKDQGSFLATRCRALETLQVQTTEFRLVRTDSEVIWVLERKQAFAGADGKAARMLAAMFDITDRKRAEEALRRREEELQHSETHLAEAQRVSHTGSWAWSPATDVRYWSEECYHIQGFDPARGLPSFESFVERIHSEDRPGFVEGLDKAVREKMDFEREYRIVHPDGAIRCIHSLAHPVLSSAGDLVEYVGTVMDVTERRFAEAERSRLEERLQQAEKMEAIGRFASGIVHDFSNILGGILAYGEMLFDDAAENTPRKRYAQNVLTAANRGRDLVDQILQYTRSQRGRHKPTDICMAVAETLELVRSSLPARITLCPAIPDAPLVMMGDATQLHQVVMNLCSNAIHAMKAGGPLGVGVTPIEVDAVLALSHGTLQPGSYIRISVADSGCGMDEATLGRSFEPFFTTKEFGRGTGLGLALVYAIVTDFEGAIDVKSVPDEGSTFSIYLPTAQAPATVAA